MHDAGDTGRTRPAAIPSITDLARHAAAFTERADALYVPGADQPVDLKDQQRTLYERDDVLRKLITCYRAKSLSDAATQLYAGFMLADYAANNELTVREHVECADALRRLFLSTLPLVAAAAKLDLTEIGADFMVEYAEREFPAEA
jgi:hypothetical protein